jgi:hypothetical protein
MPTATADTLRNDMPSATGRATESPLRRRIRTDADRADIEALSPFDLIAARTILECLQKSAAEAPDKAAIVQLDSSDPILPAPVDV